MREHCCGTMSQILRESSTTTGPLNPLTLVGIMGTFLRLTWAKVRSEEAGLGLDVTLADESGGLDVLRNRCGSPIGNCSALTVVAGGGATRLVPDSCTGRFADYLVHYREESPCCRREGEEGRVNGDVNYAGSIHAGSTSNSQAVNTIGH